RHTKSKRDWSSDVCSSDLFFLAAVLVLYIFQSCSLYSIAKRRGISNPGLAWVPVAFVWILGSVSDQYQYVVRGKVCNRRKILLRSEERRVGQEGKCGGWLG